MIARFNPTTFEKAGLLNTICEMSVLMVLVFSIRPVILSAPQFLTPEVRRSACIAQPERAPTERIPYQALLRLGYVDAGDETESAANFELPSQVPLSRLLPRRKLGSSGSGPPDHFSRPRQ